MAKRFDIQLADTEITMAYRALTATIKQASRKGGVDDLQKKLDEAKLSLSSHIFSIALRARTLSGSLCKGKFDPEHCSAVFRRMCNDAEARLVKNCEKELGYPIKQVREASPSWAVFKSQIRGSIETGADPSLYENINQLQDAAKSIAERSSGNGGNANPPDGSKGDAEGADSDAAGTGDVMIGKSGGADKMTPTLVAVLKVTAERIRGMTDEQQDEFAVKLGKVLEDFPAQAKANEALHENAAEEAAPQKDEKKTRKSA